MKRLLAGLIAFAAVACGTQSWAQDIYVAPPPASVIVQGYGRVYLPAPAVSVIVARPVVVPARVIAPPVVVVPAPAVIAAPAPVVVKPKPAVIRSKVYYRGEPVRNAVKAVLP